MVFDQSFWVAVSFVIFVAAVYKPVGSFLTKALDDRAKKIKDDLGEALRLREEAQALLASYQRKQKEIAVEAKQIIEESEKEAKRILADSQTELDIVLNKRIQLAMQKIANYEAAAVQRVKNNAVDVAISAVRTIVIDKMNKDISENLIVDAVEGMDKKLH